MRVRRGRSWVNSAAHCRGSIEARRAISYRLSRKWKQRRERVLAIVSAAGAERSEAEGALTIEPSERVRGYRVN